MHTIWHFTVMYFCEGKVYFLCFSHLPSGKQVSPSFLLSLSHHLPRCNSPTTLALSSLSPSLILLSFFFIFLSLSPFLLVSLSSHSSLALPFFSSALSLSTLSTGFFILLSPISSFSLFLLSIFYFYPLLFSYFYNLFPLILFSYSSISSPSQTLPPP